MSKKKEADIEVAEAVDKAQKPQDRTITLSSGVVLRGKQAPPLILMQVMTANPRPTPPTYKNEKMGRMMENPDDPAYIETLKAWEIERANKTLNALIMLGTELATLPKGMEGYEGNKWLDEFAMLDIPMFPENKSWRYLTWIKFKAAPSNTDLDAIKNIVGQLSGVREEDVAKAESFPGRE